MKYCKLLLVLISLQRANGQNLYEEEKRKLEQEREIEEDEEKDTENEEEVVTFICISRKPVLNFIKHCQIRLLI